MASAAINITETESNRSRSPTGSNESKKASLGSETFNEIFSQLDLNIESPENILIDKDEPKMSIKKRSKSSNQFSLTINFSLDDLDHHHLSPMVKNKIIQAYKAEEQNGGRQELRSLEELGEDDDKFKKLIMEEQVTKLSQKEFRVLTKALIARMIVEEQEREI